MTTRATRDKRIAAATAEIAREQAKKAKAQEIIDAAEAKIKAAEKRRDWLEDMPVEDSDGEVPAEEQPGTVVAEPAIDDSSDDIVDVRAEAEKDEDDEPAEVTPREAEPLTVETIRARQAAAQAARDAATAVDDGEPAVWSDEPAASTSN